VGAGVGFEVGRAEIDFDVSVRNLFDTEYTNFMSRYKTYAIDPGRNVIFRLTTRF
jgi:iron complex outermembrane receptor protein